MGEEVLRPDDTVHTVGRLLPDRTSRVLLLPTSQREAVVAVETLVGEVLVALSPEPHGTSIKEVDAESSAYLVDVGTSFLVIECHDDDIECTDESHPVLAHPYSRYMSDHFQLRGHPSHRLSRHLRFRLTSMLLSEQELPVEVAHFNRVHIDDMQFLEVEV